VDRSWDQAETWRQMEDVLAKGKVKAIGVSNWSVPYLEELSKTWKVVPAVNQVGDLRRSKGWRHSRGCLAVFADMPMLAVNQ
jgi:predicted oxidoreductase